ncbi:AAA domain-containing protein [Phthorimaea operculella]|nr:AAA domain-containing protein [Phthorimaea operculella]
MSESNKPSLRIDWFDGTLIEDSRANTSSSSAFADEEEVQPAAPPKPQFTEKKPIGFKRLLEFSALKPPILTLEIAHRPGFWNLFDSELKDDFIVLIVKILANIYKSLERGEKSKIVTMLKTRFENSNFLEVLKNYLIGLPSVRVVEKRMNAHLWDDAQGFYNDVVSLCEGIFEFGGNSNEFLNNIYDLLEITETSAIGVKEEHTETFTESLFERIVELKANIMKNIKQDPGTNDGLLQTKLENKDKNHFKCLSIFPSKEDLLEKNSVKIEPNIVNGAYRNVEQYLDLQFKLLREDCFGPLREGICKYLENPSKRRHENIRVHPKVRVIRTHITNNKVGHLVDIAWRERITTGVIDSKKYAYNKQLMFGSLLLFTSDNFETILCGTVLDSSYEMLSEGYIAVYFQNPVSKRIFSEVFLMVESEVFFEPYHRVLKVLQNSKLDDLPMKRYIVDVQKETHPPAYLSTETIYTLQDDRGEISFPVLDTKNWPDESDFGLDKSQMEAYSFALSREFAVIQGPPGTGKTFIGVKIASTLLKNLSLEGTPILIICYTNHALDQFLEGILPVTNNIVRLGSQSKSSALEPYNLNNLRSKTKSKYSSLFGAKRFELQRISKQMTEVQTEVEKCEKEIICYKYLKPYIKSKTELRSDKEDPILQWLFGYLDDKFDDDEEKDEGLDDWEKALEDEQPGDKIDTCFSQQWAEREMNSMLNSIRYVKDITDDHYEGQKMTDRFESQVNKIRRRLQVFKKRFAAEKSKNQDGETKLIEVEDLNKLTPDKRWEVYFSCVNAIKSKLMAQMHELQEQHNICSTEMEEVGTLIDGEVMRTARAVGVTTTTAARRHDLMKRLLSPIVIVEEAAEVLEAHIVASLTDKCQHLILIGDHKQLRPSAAHYKLAKHYNFEISLFERMIRNGVHARTLTIQRRMRANFVELLTPAIYERLDSHPSVNEYPNVRGMRDNLYFFTHEVFEDSEGLEDSWSHKNTLEARWCVALAKYLRQMRYSPEEITILATYTGQASLIRELSKKQPLLDDIKITVVDNYQGEENRIVILSLVRSNREGKIGFLSAANRVCVALSRAKEGKQRKQTG